MHEACSCHCIANCVCQAPIVRSPPGVGLGRSRALCGSRTKVVKIKAKVDAMKQKVMRAVLTKAMECVETAADVADDSAPFAETAAEFDTSAKRLHRLWKWKGLLTVAVGVAVGVAAVVIAVL